MFKRTMLIIVVLSLFTVPVLAQDGPPPMPEIDGEIVAEGLNSPQGLHVDGEGNLWILDSGFGGEETIEFVNPTTFEVAEATLGDSSRVIKMSPDGMMEDVAVLPSVVVGEDFIGAARITSMDGTAYVTVGAWQISNGEEVTIPYFSSVVAIADGEITQVADLWGPELANNPDGTGNLESHPYGITVGPDGMLYVADAAANYVAMVNPADGSVEIVAAFEGLPGVFPSPFRDNELLTDPVPTAVAFDADGNMYVSFLSGAPFIPGSAKIVQVSADGEVTDFAPGLTMVTDLQAGPDGNMYATSFGMFTQEGPVFNSGSVLRIMPDGTYEVVVEGLPFVTALALDADGNGYVSINGAGIPMAGMVVKYEGLTSMEGMPMMMPDMAPAATEEAMEPASTEEAGE